MLKISQTKTFGRYLKQLATSGLLVDSLEISQNIAFDLHVENREKLACGRHFENIAKRGFLVDILKILQEGILGRHLENLRKRASWLTF